ncbi:hypothetical protein JKP88DRAFT_251248 [Tribonema minus]|uniref:PDZ domain-containing protein n=1 Tax=Tribonema minus TaxID=303371 RepID=A0A835ZJA6_9STRA|nr:hypothetical protein JKP88DRAFT_251248 [Tribonema minus]
MDIPILAQAATAQAETLLSKEARHSKMMASTTAPTTPTPSAGADDVAVDSAPQPSAAAALNHSFIERSSATASKGAFGADLDPEVMELPLIEGGLDLDHTGYPLPPPPSARGSGRFGAVQAFVAKLSRQFQHRYEVVDEAGGRALGEGAPHSPGLLASLPLRTPAVRPGGGVGRDEGAATALLEDDGEGEEPAARKQGAAGRRPGPSGQCDASRLAAETAEWAALSRSEAQRFGQRQAALREMNAEQAAARMTDAAAAEAAAAAAETDMLLRAERTAHAAMAEAEADRERRRLIAAQEHFTFNIKATAVRGLGGWGLDVKKGGACSGPVRSQVCTTLLSVTVLDFHQQNRTGAASRRQTYRRARRKAPRLAPLYEQLLSFVGFNKRHVRRIGHMPPKQHRILRRCCHAADAVPVSPALPPPPPTLPVQAGDVLVSINGVALRDFAHGVALMRSMTGAASIIARRAKTP